MAKSSREPCRTFSTVKPNGGCQASSGSSARLCRSTVCTELRSRVRATRVRIPDVSIYAGAEPTESVPAQPPLVAIEILLPADRHSELMRKFEEYSAWGVRHIWLVDPESRKLHIFTDGTLSEVSALPIPEFAVQLTAAQIFG